MTTMLAIKFFVLAITFIIFVAVGIRNVNRNFSPAVRSHLELFLAGAPIGFVGMFILIPSWPTAIVYGVFTGILTGLSLSYSTPRQWRYWNEPRLPKKE